MRFFIFSSGERPTESNNIYIPIRIYIYSISYLPKRRLARLKYAISREILAHSETTMDNFLSTNENDENL